MTSIHTSFKTITRAAVVALALGATSLTAAPAFAQGAPSGFSLQLPGGNGDTQRSQTFGNGPQGNHGGWDDDYGFRCLTNREVRRGIAAYGFRRVEIVRELRRDRVEVRAVYGNWLYSMRVDKCTGEVNRVRRIGRVFGGGFNGGGFGLQFNFGN
jgi:hypothetical protein